MVFGYVAFPYHELLVSQGRIQGGGESTTPPPLFFWGGETPNLHKEGKNVARLTYHTLVWFTLLLLKEALVKCRCRSKISLIDRAQHSACFLLCGLVCNISAMSM